MQHTTSDVVLTKMRQETNYFYDFYAVFFHHLRYVLSMFLNFGHFSASCSYRKRSYWKKSIPREVEELRTRRPGLPKNYCLRARTKCKLLVILKPFAPAGQSRFNSVHLIGCKNCSLILSRSKVLNLKLKLIFALFPPTYNPHLTL